MGTTTLVASGSDRGLAAVGAWNARRMQNVILAIGPGMPAWNVDVADGREVDEDDDEDDNILFLE